MEAGAGQVGRIGCLLVMILVLCAAGIETASGYRNSNNSHHHHQQGGTSKSRLLTKTDSSINQQDQGSMMTIKSLASSGEYIPQLIFLIKTDQQIPVSR